MTCNVKKPVKFSWAEFHDWDRKITAGVAQGFERYIQYGGCLPGIKQQNPRVKLLKVRKSASTAAARSGHANLPKTAGAQANKNKRGLACPRTDPIKTNLAYGQCGSKAEGAPGRRGVERIASPGEEGISAAKNAKAANILAASVISGGEI